MRGDGDRRYQHRGTRKIRKATHGKVNVPDFARFQAKLFRGMKVGACFGFEPHVFNGAERKVFNRVCEPVHDAPLECFTRLERCSHHGQGNAPPKTLDPVAVHGGDRIDPLVSSAARVAIRHGGNRRLIELNARSSRPE